MSPAATVVSTRTPVSQPPDWGFWRTLRRPLSPLPKGLDRVAARVRSRLVGRPPGAHHWLARAEAVRERADALRTVADAGLAERAEALRASAGPGFSVPEREGVAALAFECVRRGLSIELHPVQIAAGLGLAHGHLVELATGEGKTFAAAIPVVEAGLRGAGCHVVTVNDYLAERDASLLAPAFALLGLEARAVVAGSSPAERRRAYQADATYATHKELCADFVRDRLGSGRAGGLPELLSASLCGRGASRPLLRGLAFALVDEADSVLVDDAVTPLLLSAEEEGGEATAGIRRADEFVADLVEGEDFALTASGPVLLDTGRERLERAIREDPAQWAGSRRSADRVSKALTARQLYRRDEHYVVQEGRVVIVDEATGRLMPDRSWRDGLHQAVEAKEQLDIRPASETAARSSFQRFFRRYRHLCGMTGTAREASGELREVYGVETLVLPTHAPCRRVQRPGLVFASSEDRWRALVDEVARAHEIGRPVLVGTRSVRASEALAERLEARGLPHRVLNAHSHQEEARIVAEAGQPGAVTVATNMAGRGTDIALGGGAARELGLLVLASEHHGTARVDRQLFGRAARQGDPGTVQALVSLEDDLFERDSRASERALLARLGRSPAPLARALTGFVVARIQRRAERRVARRRRQMLLEEEQSDERLAFAPPA